MILHEPTPDVAAMVAALEARGFVNTLFRGGPTAPTGNQQAVWEHAGTRVLLNRDRGQWTLLVQCAGWRRVHTLAALDTWRRGVPFLPERASFAPQLPEGLAWATTVPALLDWLAEQPDAEATLTLREAVWRDALARR